MSDGPWCPLGRRDFLASCAAPLLTRAWSSADDDPSAAVSWDGAVDAYLEGHRDEAARVMTLAPAVLAEQARRRLVLWAGDASADAPDLRRRAVRGLQASAALALEIPRPLSAQGRTGSGGVLDSIAATAVKILKSRELPGMPLPETRDGASPHHVRQRMTVFRGRWNVAYLQQLINDRQLLEAMTVAAHVELPAGDPSLPDAWYLRGLVAETSTHLLREPISGDTDGRRASPRRPWIDGQLRDAARWYRQSLGASPTHQEARLHLGRVELERGRFRMAINVLEPLRGMQDAGWIGGLAWLFTGDCHLALGALHDAQHALERAALVPDVWQSSLVTLMQLALRRGDLATAADLSTQFERADVSATADPDAWLAYLAGRRRDAQAVLEPMRAAILA